MQQLLRSFERRNKAAIKHKFLFEPTQLTLETTHEKHCPEQIQLVFIHRRKRYSSKPRRLESSCTIDSRRLVVWPESMADPIEFDTTLYSRSADDDILEDKNWTLVLEGTMASKGDKSNGKKRIRSLASAELNMRALVGHPGCEVANLQLGMRPLHHGISFCLVEMRVVATSQARDQLHSPSPSTPGQLERTDVASRQISITLGSLSPRLVGPSRVEVEATMRTPIMVDMGGRGPDLSFTPPSQPGPKVTVEQSESIEWRIRQESTSGRQLDGDETLDTHQTDCSIHPSTPIWAAPPPVKGFATQPAGQKPRANANDANGHEDNGNGTTTTKMATACKNPLPMPASAPARSHPVTTKAAVTNNNANGTSTPSKGSSGQNIIRPKPVAPSQAEVQAMIAQIIASKRPGV